MIVLCLNQSCGFISIWFCHYRRPRKKNLVFLFVPFFGCIPIRCNVCMRIWPWTRTHPGNLFLQRIKKKWKNHRKTPFRKGGEEIWNSLTSTVSTWKSPMLRWIQTDKKNIKRIHKIKWKIPAWVATIGNGDTWRLDVKLNWNSREQWKWKYIDNNIKN